MKRFFQALPILCTLLLVGLGAFMPRIASLAFDRQLKNDVVVLENKSISLALEQEANFFETLELFGSGTSQVELSEGYHMKLADARAAAVAARMHLTGSGAADKALEVTPVLITGRSTPGLSGIFWHCVWSSTFTNAMGESRAIKEVLWLDDQSGRVVSFSGLADWSDLSAYDSLFPQSAVDVTEYLRLHYPVDTVKLALTEEDTPGLSSYPVDTTVSIASEERETYTYEDASKQFTITEYAPKQFTITLTKSQNGQSETYTIPMRMANGRLSFNEMLF